MGLFDPGWMTDNNKKQAKAIEYVRNRVNDDETLLCIIKQAKLNEVKKTAAEKLNSDAARLKAILECDGIFVQGAALKGIKDRSLIDRNTYFAQTDSFAREKLIGEINDERLLGEIVQYDPNPNNRLLALEKTSDEDIARAALKDKDEKVRAEAVLHIHDNDVLVRYLSNYEKIPYKKQDELFARIDSFTKEQLETLLEVELNDATGLMKKHICSKAGHQRGENCRCIRCGVSMEHDFDEKGTCTYCGGRMITERETLKIMGEPYGYRNNQVIVYSDGRRETVKQGLEVVTADEDKMKWLLSDN